MDERLARAGVAHLDRVAGLDGDVRLEVVVDHGLDGARSDLGGNVARLELAEHLVDEDAIRHLRRDLGEMLVAAMHGVARLEGGDLRPAPPFELGARFLGPQIEPLYFAGYSPSESAITGPPMLTSPCRITFSTPGCLGSVVRNTCLHSSSRSMRVLLPHREAGREPHRSRHRRARPLRQRARLSATSLRQRQRDRDGPEHAVGELHLGDRARQSS